MAIRDEDMATLVSDSSACSSDALLGREIHGRRRSRREQSRTVMKSPRLDKSVGRETHRLLEWHELSAWRQHGSEHLQTGYRQETASLWQCLVSWTYMHNDTVNIFSHVVGAVAFLLLPIYIFRSDVLSRYDIATPADIFVCSLYFLGVGICFMVSTLFHTLMPHSQVVYNFGIKLDYQGILLLMWGSTVPLAYYSFPCRTDLQVVYWTVTTVLGAMCSFATFHPRIGGPHLGHVRALLFGSFGAGSFLAPIAHGIFLYGFAAQSRRIGLGWIELTVLFNGLGVSAYAFKIPERLYPRLFDIFGASHQIMHVFVVFGALAYACAVLKAFDFRHEHIVACQTGFSM